MTEQETRENIRLNDLYAEGTARGKRYMTLEDAQRLIWLRENGVYNEERDELEMVYTYHSTFNYPKCKECPEREMCDFHIHHFDRRLCDDYAKPLSALND